MDYNEHADRAAWSAVEEFLATLPRAAVPGD
jgi:hypothetical protein